MFCKKCGTSLPPEARFCKKCGTPATATKPISAVPTPPAPPEPAAAPPVKPPQMESAAAPPHARQTVIIADEPLPLVAPSLPPPPVAPPAPPSLPSAPPPLPRSSAPPTTAAIAPPHTSPSDAEQYRRTAPPPPVTPPSGAGEPAPRDSSPAAAPTSSSDGAQSSRRIWLAAAICVVILAGAGVAWWWSGRDTAPTVKQQTAAPNAPAAPSGMVYVPGGELKMGNDAGAVSERPAYKIAVKPFFIDRHEVTCEQYAQFIAATGHRAPPGWSNGRYPAEAAQHPVTGVDWDDASAYAAWAGKRLPTEQEWEFAARGAEGRRYPWGNEWQAAAANADAGNAGGMINVGTYAAGASPFGANDLVGNAWEWTASDWVPYPGGALPPSELSGPLKVIRGGSFEGDQQYATTTFRIGWPARGHKDYNQTGFRCAQDVGGANDDAQRVKAVFADNTMVGVINNSEVVQGCGCYFNAATDKRANSTRYVFLAGYDAGHAWMNIDGKDVKLPLTRSVEAPGELKVGSRSVEHYAAGDITVEIEKVVTKLCEEEGCEVTDYAATINLVNGRRTQTAQAKGGCGC